MKLSSRTWLCALLLLCLGCGPSRFFYYPNRLLYSDPHKSGIDYNLLEIPSLNGKILSGIPFHTENPKPAGTVVHFHGNFGNVSNHYMQSQFLMNHGFDVLVFDYQGYGGSEGKPNPKGTIEDGVAVVRYARDHSRSELKNVFIFGQSLGGAVGIVVMSKETYVRAGVFEAAFTSYRSMVRKVTAGTWILWPLYPIYPWFMGTRYDPIKYVEKIAPRPVLFIHGTADRIVPTKMSRLLFDKAREPKELWIVDGSGHLQPKWKEGKKYEERVASFFKEAAT